MTEFRLGDIEGVMVRELKKFHDARGWLTELYREDELPEGMRPVMSYVSMTLPGVTRGPHEHRDQADCFAFLTSRMMLICWDNRSGSKTYMNKMVVYTGQDEPKCVVVPPGVVHAYKNIGDSEGVVMNFPDRLFAGAGRKEPVDEIRYEHDPNTPFQVEA